MNMNMHMHMCAHMAACTELAVVTGATRVIGNGSAVVQYVCACEPFTLSSNTVKHNGLEPRPWLGPLTAKPSLGAKAL